MLEMSCRTCAYSYVRDPEPLHIRGVPIILRCSCPDYNSEAYTLEKFMEDRNGNRCRFWIPQKHDQKYNERKENAP